MWILLAGSALPGVDYVDSSTSFSFLSGTNLGYRCLTVRILGEVGLERTKTFQVTLALTSPNPNVNVDNSRTDIHIYDGTNISRTPHKSHPKLKAYRLFHRVPKYVLL